MATKTVSRLFDNHEDARAAVRELEAAGFSSADVGIAASNADNRYTTTSVEEGTKTGTGAAVGASLGTLVGGGAGAAAALGALAIPGFGPVVAAGLLFATLAGAGAGAAAGGIVGSLTGMGVSEKDAHVYAEGLQRGGSLVTVKLDETRELEALTILDRYTHVDVAAREAEYRKEGWDSYVDRPDRPVGH